MEASNIILFSLSILLLFFSTSHGISSNLFREYIGAKFIGTKFSDVPINPNVNFHFILAFAIDYTDAKSPSPTNGKFNVFWDAQNLGPTEVASIKSRHRNVRVAVSLGGDSVNNEDAYFAPKSISSWVSNAVASLTKIIRLYNLDGIDIDYEHFSTDDPNTFADCIGQLVATLKKEGVISFASIAPYDDDGPVQSHYLALWRKYGHVIDYVNFQFYAYDEGTTVAQFLGFFKRQVSNYKGGRVLASFTTDGRGGLEPGEGFLEACKELKKKGTLGGIFVWSTDDSKKFGYRHEKPSQQLLASA